MEEKPFKTTSGGSSGSAHVPVSRFIFTGGSGARSRSMSTTKPTSLPGFQPKVPSVIKEEGQTFRPELRFTPNVKVQLNASATHQSTAAAAQPTQTTDIGALLAHGLKLQQGQAIQPETTSFNRRGPAPPIHGSQLSRSAMMQQLRAGKKGDLKKSKSLLDLSWADKADFASYTPISLPYVYREAEKNDSQVLERPNVFLPCHNSTETKRPSVKHVDEVNRNAATLFDPPAEETEDLERVWYLMQFPRAMPALDTDSMQQRETERFQKGCGSAAQPQTSAKKTETPRYLHSTIESFPEGRLGKIQIHRSGKVKMKIGEHLFDINQGSECDFAQEVACFMESNSELSFLGKCSRRIIVVPNMPFLIEKAEQEVMDKRSL